MHRQGHASFSQHEQNKVILLEGCPTPCVAGGMCMSVRLGRGVCCVVVLHSGDLKAKQGGKAHMKNT